MSGFIPMVKPTGRCFGSRSKTERSIDSKHDSLNDATFLARHAVRFLAKNLRPNVIVNITYWREAPHVSEERPIGRGRAHHGGSRLRPRRGSLVRDPGRQRGRRSHPRPEVILQALESRLGGDKTRQEG